MSTRTALVVGAGVIGVACAWSLQRRGYTVTLVDAEEPGERCSFGNAGNISPGSVVPYAVPGSLRRIPRWLFDPRGPLSIRPAYFGRFLPWGWQWLAASKVECSLATSRAMRALHGGSVASWRALLAEAGGAAAAELVQPTGQLYVSKVPGKALGTQLERFMREAAGVRVQGLSGAQVQEVEPALAPAYCSGLLLPDNGSCVNPGRLVKTLAGRVAASGGRIVRGRVQAFESGPVGPRGVRLADGTVLQAAQIVVAAGAWSNELIEQVGTRVPLEAERGYHVTLAEPGVRLRIPVTNRDAGFACAPMEMGLRLAGTAEYAGLQAAPNWRRAQVLLEQGREMFPGLRTESHTRWMGLRPSLPDGLPVIDRSPFFPNVLFAFGNSHFGMTVAPAVGKLVAELALHEAPSIDPAPYRVSRFTGPGSHGTVAPGRGAG
jgi:D-amino-acid dehydrogenase